MTPYEDTCGDCPERKDALDTAEATIARLTKLLEVSESANGLWRRTHQQMCEKVQLYEDAYNGIAGVWRSRTSTPLVYIAAPYRGSDTAAKVADAVAMWETLTASGFDAVCPHVLSERLDPHNLLGDEWWLAHTSRLMCGCTHVVRLPGDSLGADAECDRAREVGIGVHYATDCHTIPETFLAEVHE